MSNKRHCLAFTLFLAFFVLAGTRVQAALIVEVVDSNIATGSTGYVDVAISSTSTDPLGLFFYHFKISEVGNPIGTLEFVDPQPPPYSDPNYVFAGNSDVTTFTLGSLSPSDYKAGDTTLNNQNETVTTVQKLLVRLAVKHSVNPNDNPNLAIGDQYEISLQNNSDSQFFTLLPDASIAQLTLNLSSFDPGVVTISAAVPEPSTLILVPSVLATVSLLRRRRIVV